MLNNIPTLIHHRLFNPPYFWPNKNISEKVAQCRKFQFLRFLTMSVICRCWGSSASGTTEKPCSGRCDRSSCTTTWWMTQSRLGKCTRTTTEETPSLCSCLAWSCPRTSTRCLVSPATWLASFYNFGKVNFLNFLHMESVMYIYISAFFYPGKNLCAWTNSNWCNLQCLIIPRVVRISGGWLVGLSEATWALWKENRINLVPVNLILTSNLHQIETQKVKVWL